MIAETWERCIDDAGDYSSVPLEAVQKLITSTRQIMSDAGWPAVRQHIFFVSLKKEIKRQSLGHPTTLQMIRLLEIETELEFN